MKSFSGDEGYQAPCSRRLIEQEFYIANYVVCIPLVRTVLSRGSPVGCGIFAVVKYKGHLGRADQSEQLYLCCACFYFHF